MTPQPPDPPASSPDPPTTEPDPSLPGATPAPPSDDGASRPAPPPRLGASTFTIEGRAAPGLFVLGWLATLTGIGAIVVAIMSGTGLAGSLLLLGGLIVLSIGLVAGAGGQAIERRAQGRLPYVGPSPFLVFLAGIPLSGVLLIATGFVFDMLGISVDGPLGRLASVVVQAVVYIGLIRFLVVGTGALSWRAMGITRPQLPALGDLGLGALAALPVILATIPVAALVTRFLPTPPQSPLPPAGDLPGTLVNLLAGVVVAPISEEIMFRGFATTAWMKGMGRWRGVIRGALFFAVVHVLTISGVDARQAVGVALAAFLGRIPVAFALGWLFQRTGTIWAPLGLHAAFNGILLVLAEVAARSGIPAP
ncbi:MAG TPA: type II CAAX endopeptidase family protein [Candidatus Limnocylindrales bacterium]|nr:type II CAAX endopeptidase family protein [Candidatus Limnocylindrales bacterium]